MPPSTMKGTSGGGSGGSPAESYNEMEETLIRVASAKSLMELSRSGSLEGASFDQATDQIINASSSPRVGKSNDQASPSHQTPPTSNAPIDGPTSSPRGGTTTEATASNSIAATAIATSIGTSMTNNDQVKTALPIEQARPIAPTGQPTSQTGSSSTNASTPVTSDPRTTSTSASPSSPSSKQQPTSTTTSTRPTRSTKSKGTALRRGKWTPEEEAYVARVIHDFNNGFLNVASGTTLRSYLSEKLQCDPMRITKKFTGDACIGKRVFHRAVRTETNAAIIDKAQIELDELEQKWRRRLELQQRESAKKAAASAAHANRGLVSGGGGAAGLGGPAVVQGVPVAMLGGGSQGLSDRQSAVDQAASWLDRANAILKGSVVANAPVSSPEFRDSIQSSSSSSASSNSNNMKEESTQSSGDSSLENQMKEVQRLIHEGPGIQKASAGLTNLLLQNAGLSTGASPYASASGTTTPPPEPSTLVAQPSPTSEPVDKRLRTTSDPTTSDSLGTKTAGTEDAEALVGFLMSVRASAAADEHS